MLTVVTAYVPGLTGVTLLSRLVGQNGRSVTQASLSTIAWTATDLTAGAVVSTGSFVVATSIFDSLQQNDPRWVKDSKTAPGPDGQYGYNFLGGPLAYNLLAAATPVQVPAGWPEGAAVRPVRVDVAFSPVGGVRFTVSWVLKIQPAYG